MALDLGLEFRGGVAAPTAQQTADQRIPVAASPSGAGTNRELHPVLDWESGPTLAEYGALAGAYARPCRAATTGNVNLIAPPSTVDGVTLASGDRVLVWQQSTASQNGIYVYTPGNLSRSNDTLPPGCVVRAVDGTIYGACEFWLTNTTQPTIGTDAITFEPLRRLTSDGVELQQDVDCNDNVLENFRHFAGSQVNIPTGSSYTTVYTWSAGSLPIALGEIRRIGMFVVTETSSGTEHEALEFSIRLQGSTYYLRDVNSLDTDSGTVAGAGATVDGTLSASGIGTRVIIPGSGDGSLNIQIEQDPSATRTAWIVDGWYSRAVTP